MLNLKKTAVAVLAFGSSAVFAGSMGPVCAPGNVTVPCASTAWDFGAQALYLQPSMSGHAYNGADVTYDTTAVSDFDPNGVYAANESYRKAPYNWGWGFKLEGSYHFNTGNDLNLNWYWFDHTNTKTSAGVLTTLDGGNIWGDSGISSTTQTQWDAVNLEFGQHVHFGEWKNIRFHGGVQYAYINNELDYSSNIYAVPNTDQSIYGVSLTGNTKFSGFGPRIGADYWYNWGNGISMYANGATALLVGTQSFNSTLASTTNVGNTNTVNPTIGQTGSATAIVPELEAKLGLTYTYAMAQGDLSLDVGWMWVDYIDALSRGTGSLDSFFNGPGFGSTKESNFAVQGPYIGLKWVGNVA